MSLADELDELHRLKEAAEDVGRDKKKADAAFKEQEHACLERMAADRAESFRTGGYLYTANQERVKGQVEDRRKYIDYALDNDEAVADFIDWVLDKRPLKEGVLRGQVYDMLRNLSGLHLKEDQRVLNDLAKSALDDEVAMPPGTTFRPDPYIQKRAS